MLNVSVSAPDVGDDESRVVVSLAGRAVIGDCAWFHQLLDLHGASGPGPVIIDLSELRSMDWWAAQILLWAGRVVNRRGGTLVLASPQPPVARLLSAVDSSIEVQAGNSTLKRNKEMSPLRFKISIVLR